MSKLFNGCKVAFHYGKGTKNVCRKHNNRTDNREHTDIYKATHKPEKAHLNEYLIDYDMKDFFHQTFDEAIDKFNQKQTETRHEDRKINFDDYFKEHKKYCFEAIISLGNKEHQPLTDEEYKKAFHEIVDKWQEKYPSMKVFGAYIHMDETTPHLHLDFLPVTSNSRGLTTKVSTDGALKELGYVRTKNDKYDEKPFLKFFEDEVRHKFLEEEIFRKYCPTLTKAEHCDRKHQSQRDFIREQINEEIDKEQRQLEQIREEKLQASKKSIFGNKVSISQEEYTSLTNADKELKSTHRRINEKEKELDMAIKRQEQITANAQQIARINERETQNLLDLQKTGAELLENEQQYINQKANEKASAMLKGKTEELTKAFDSELKKVKDREQILKDSEKRIKQRDERRLLSSSKVKSIIKQKEGENKNVNRPHQFNR